MAPVLTFRIDLDIHNLLMNSDPTTPRPPAPKGMTLPEPVFPHIPRNWPIPVLSNR